MNPIMEDNIFNKIKELKEIVNTIEELATDEFKDYGFDSVSGLIESLKAEVKQGYKDKDFENKIKKCIKLLEE